MLVFTVDFQRKRFGFTPFIPKSHKRKGVLTALIKAKDYEHQKGEIPVLFLEPVGSMFLKLETFFQSQDKAKAVRCISLSDAVSILRKTELGLVFIYVPNKPTLMRHIALIKVLQSMISKRNVQVIALTVIPNQGLKNILLKSGCTEVFSEPVQQKVFEMKVERSIRELQHRFPLITKNNRELAEQAQVKRHVSDANSLAQTGDVVWGSALSMKSDCWITKGQAVPRKVMGTWMVSFIGPSPEVGRWEECEDGASDQQCWRWMPLKTKEFPFINELGSWRFLGRKPDFREDQWHFIAKKPKLYFEFDPITREGEAEPVQIEPVQIEPVQIEPVQIEPVQIEPVQIEPVQIDKVVVREDGALCVAKNPDDAESIIRLIEKSFDVIFNLKIEKKGDDENRGFKNDKKEETGEFQDKKAKSESSGELYDKGKEKETDIQNKQGSDSDSPVREQTYSEQEAKSETQNSDFIDLSKKKKKQMSDPMSTTSDALEYKGSLSDDLPVDKKDPTKDGLKDGIKDGALRDQNQDLSKDRDEERNQNLNQTLKDVGLNPKDKATSEMTDGSRRSNDSDKSADEKKSNQDQERGSGRREKQKDDRDLESDSDEETAYGQKLKARLKKENDISKEALEEVERLTKKARFMRRKEEERREAEAHKREEEEKKSKKQPKEQQSKKKERESSKGTNSSQDSSAVENQDGVENQADEKQALDEETQGSAKEKQEEREMGTAPGPHMSLLALAFFLSEVLLLQDQTLKQKARRFIERFSEICGGLGCELWIRDEGEWACVTTHVGESGTHGDWIKEKEEALQRESKSVGSSEKGKLLIRVIGATGSTLGGVVLHGEFAEQLDQEFAEQVSKLLIGLMLGLVRQSATARGVTKENESVSERDAA
jgi:hypothetical protein